MNSKDTLILQSKVYISAKRAVQVSGYSPDYIGQLCREDKLECKMVGRSWFVTEDSLLKHKESVKQESPVEKVKITQTFEVKSDSVIVDRKNFISAKKASEISGYTTDYIGQLCRLGKLESTRVGNAWYVSEKSILNHCIAIAQESSKVETRALIVPVVAPIIEKIIVTAPLTKKIESVAPKRIDDKKEEVVTQVKSSFFPTRKLIIGLSVSLAFIIGLFETINYSNYFSKESQSASVVNSATYSSPPSLNALAVTPSSGSVSQDEAIKKKIQDSFSDEVKITPDQSGTAGVITPVFKKVKDQGFVYVMVPINNP